MNRPSVAGVCAALLAVLAAAGCGASTTTIDVFAASSLTDAFSEIEARFEAENPQFDVRLNLAGSDTLRRQIDDGADAHVFAPASTELFEGLDTEPIAYASNQLVVITIDDSAVNAKVAGGDFDGLLVARCADGVPCGEAADALVSALGLDLSGATVTAEANVRAVSAKVALGEADAGFVYRTDAMAAGDGVLVTPLGAPEATVVLSIGVLVDNAAAEDFVEFAVAQTDVFDSLGFDPAP